MPIVLVLRLREHLKCEGCGAIDRMVSKKSHLCLYCLGLKLDVDARKRKLQTTLEDRFAHHA